ncbi:hypothetical protein BS47DRAFT_1369076 [Hydnum rufescens UP504]|uniref:Uncharacterized protein n=1 Tax=Hydnum rufescens UP504 TaxID=1448309 RepID=A0A9P6AEV1_9AGAM|nr:hypothetical protein BS47DRAFT_1369076 [Hydnum rufescens UP504]
MTPPNEHGRTMTHPPNESRERQRSKPQCKPRMNPTPAEAGVVIFKVRFLSEPGSPQPKPRPDRVKTRDMGEGNPNGEARNDVPGTTHLPKRYHTPTKSRYYPHISPYGLAASLRFSKSQFGQFSAILANSGLRSQKVMGPTLRTISAPEVALTRTTRQTNPPPPVRNDNAPANGESQTRPAKRNSEMRMHDRAQGPQTNHTPASADQNRTRGTKQVPHTHFCGIQIKPPETTTHPNGHPSVRKTKYKARDQGAKLVPHTRFGGFLPPVKTHLTSTWASPQYAQPPKQRGPAPRTRRLTKPRTTHPLRRALSQHKNPRTTQPDPRTCDHGAKNEYHTPASAVCHLNPTPMTPPNEHGRTMTHPPNESRERQRVETTMQAPDEPHTRRSGCGILLNPDPPTEATTRPSENT